MSWSDVPTPEQPTTWTRASSSGEIPTPAQRARSGATPWLMLIAVLASPPVAGGELTFTTANGSAEERATVEQLQRLIAEHDLERWQYTDEVLVDEKAAIPFSHPVLTMNTDGRDDHLVATYLHEQLHWWVSRAAAAREAAIAEHRELFPDAPGREGGGARDSYSSLLHLIVCDLELQATSMAIGEERARAVLESLQHYPWIYERVLNDPRVRAVNARHGFLAILGQRRPPLEVELAHDSEGERRTAERLRELIAEHHLERFQLTEKILIDERSTPHSHPVLTLHTRHLGADERLISAYVHEQLHWMEEAMTAQRAAAKDRLRELFPDAPSEGGGAGGLDGTLLHLIVCDLELQAMTDLLGAEPARALLAGKTYYQWIYDKVLHDPRVREVNREWGFVAPPG